jgi:hypothetical protein
MMPAAPSIAWDKTGENRAVLLGLLCGFLKVVVSVMY